MLAVTLVGLGLLAAAGCDRRSGQGADAAPQEIFATVDGEPVTRAEIESVAELLASRRPGRDAPSEDAAFDAWQDAHLLRQFVAERGLDADETFRERRAAIRARAWRAEQELARNALVSALEKDVAVTEEELRALYEENAQRYLTTRLHLRQITVPDRATIQTIRKQLADGVAFEELAAHANLDPALRQKGGDLGWVEQRKLPTSVIGPAHRLVEPGSVTDPFQDREGRWNLVQLVGREKAARRSFESVRDQLEYELRVLRSREALAALLDERRATLAIERVAAP